MSVTQKCNILLQWHCTNSQ